MTTTNNTGTNIIFDIRRHGGLLKIGFDKIKYFTIIKVTGK